jgi:hypothetical protein
MLLAFAIPCLAETLKITSTPPGATVELDGVPVGVTSSLVFGKVSCRVLLKPVEPDQRQHQSDCRRCSGNYFFFLQSAGCLDLRSCYNPNGLRRVKICGFCTAYCPGPNRCASIRRVGRADQGICVPLCSAIRNQDLDRFSGHLRRVLLSFSFAVSEISTARRSIHRAQARA